MRRFKIENGSATISKDGEFLHINDIMLLIIKERESVQGMLNALPTDEDEWVKKSKLAYERQIEMLDGLKDYIMKSE